MVTPDPPAATGNVPATKTEELVEYKALFAAVNPVKPVPPLEVANVPPSVIAPDVGVEGVKPVVPPEKDCTTVEDREAHVGEPVPPLTNICPTVPAAVKAVVLGAL